MTEFSRKDSAWLPEQSSAGHLNPEAKLAERTASSNTDSRTLLTPPPSEPQPVPVANRAVASPAAVPVREEERIPLFPFEEANQLRARWDSVQVGFVDEPRKAVEEADALVAATMKRLAEIFAEERQKLEQEWDRSETVSTEDFRLALHRYRSFFARLLTI